MNRKKIALSFLLVCLAPVMVRADGSVVSPPPATTPVEVPPAGPDLVPVQPLPLTTEPLPKPEGVKNSRELSEEEYSWLGKLLWKNIEPRLDHQKAEYSAAELDVLVDDMRRNRNEVNLSLEDLAALMGSKVLSSGAEGCVPSTPAGEAFGIEIDEIGEWFK